jgi:hypothetical protein
VFPLPEGISHDPISVLVALLEAGQSPAQVWPATSDGFQVLLKQGADIASRDPGASTAQGLDPPEPESRSQDQKILQELMRQHLIGHPDAPRSAIRVHPTMQDWIKAAQRRICSVDWAMDPSLARVVCATREEAARIEALLNQDPEPGRGEDLLGSARSLVENLYQPGVKAPRVSPVLVAEEVPADAQLQEMFLSPGCRGLTGQELLPAVRAARLGLHLVRL